MGCHTWFYKKVERTVEEAREIALECQRNVVKHWGEIDPNTDETCIAYGWNELTVIETIFEETARLRQIQEGDLYAIWSNQPDGDGVNYYNPVTGNFYVNDPNVHDLIRVGNYPEIRFFSFDEIYQWILNHREHPRFNTSKITVQEIEAVKNYFETNPNAMVCFG
jgi:hypothetical protein